MLEKVCARMPYKRRSQFSGHFASLDFGAFHAKLDFFNSYTIDRTEMHEMLTLRIVTLTDQEKDEMRLAGERARDLLESTEQNAREQLMRMHGTIRSLRRVNEG